METLIEGGNGVDSLLGEMPDEPPERYEAGTLPIPAIVGLCEGISAIEQIGIDNVERHERELFEIARRKLGEVLGVRIYCSEHSGSVLLFSVDGVDSERVCEYLARSGICVRGGYHCAPLAHRAIGTADSGAVRISFGVFNNEKDIDTLVDALEKIIAIL